MDLRRLAATAAAAAALTMSSPAATAAPGGLDPAFGNAGIARIQGPAGADAAIAVAIDAQGRIRHRKMGATHFDELATWARAMGPA